MFCYHKNERLRSEFKAKKIVSRNKPQLPRENETFFFFFLAGGGGELEDHFRASCKTARAGNL